MSVIVKGMDMPRSCNDCPCSSDYVGIDDLRVCYASPTGIEIGELITDFYEVIDENVKDPEWCPLVVLPEKHGRLIDADSLRENIESFGGILPEEINTFLIILEQEKTIIESEE